MMSKHKLAILLIEDRIDTLTATKNRCEKSVAMSVHYQETIKDCKAQIRKLKTSRKLLEKDGN